MQQWWSDSDDLTNYTSSLNTHTFSSLEQELEHDADNLDGDALMFCQSKFDGISLIAGFWSDIFRK